MEIFISFFGDFTEPFEGNFYTMELPVDGGIVEFWPVVDQFHKVLNILKIQFPQMTCEFTSWFDYITSVLIKLSDAEECLSQEANTIKDFMKTKDILLIHPAQHLCSPYSYLFSHVRCNNTYSGYPIHTAPSSNYDPNDPSAIEEQLALQMQMDLISKHAPYVKLFPRASLLVDGVGAEHRFAVGGSLEKGLLTAVDELLWADQPDDAGHCCSKHQSNVFP
ncbi:uncharacterized protein EDB91DRAFT_1243362 [Suillus paluster]|uniref:uncharacterized protein n=1 Tax=Suillus paluster TaxID=48578 RepID=UPI001B86B521|nr:uncharacterized protein EDB91DRAFT_1243362 [Suillus paluster]KAG1752597.1 hypothetical protein EDB91DRAFT_1243362 [Suillus paluster]